VRCLCLTGKNSAASLLLLSSRTSCQLVSINLVLPSFVWKPTQFGSTMILFNLTIRFSLLRLICLLALVSIVDVITQWKENNIYGPQDYYPVVLAPVIFSHHFLRCVSLETMPVRVDLSWCSPTSVVPQCIWPSSQFAQISRSFLAYCGDLRYEPLQPHAFQNCIEKPY